MNEQACPLPTPPSPEEKAPMERMLAGRRIAVVGLSDDPTRPSYEVAQYLASIGLEIIPVNPKCERVLGRKCYASLREVPGKIDVVDVFRRAEFCPEVVKEAIAVGAGGVWLQSGVRSPQAKKLAQEAGMDYVEDRCLKVEHARR
ncbi:MAG: CoA-binding protein [Phycisphaerales bacterium]|jgi:predicted CoA-binding protein|nr:CoA-binding protein [Phycisphaerales bacterium]